MAAAGLVRLALEQGLQPCVLVTATLVAWPMGRWAGARLGRRWPALGWAWSELGWAGGGVGRCRAGLDCGELELQPVYSQSTHVCWSRQHGWHRHVLGWAGAGLALDGAGAGLILSWVELRLQLG